MFPDLRLSQLIWYYHLSSDWLTGYHWPATTAWHACTTATGRQLNRQQVVTVNCWQAVECGHNQWTTDWHLKTMMMLRAADDWCRRSLLRELADTPAPPSAPTTSWTSPCNNVRLVVYTVHTSELRDITCHTVSHSVSNSHHLTRPDVSK